MMFILSLNFTDQGIRGIKDAPKRAQAARELAKKMGAEIKQIYLTTGDADLVAMVEAPNGDSMVKFSMALGMQGNRARLACGGVHEAGRRAALTRARRHRLVFGGARAPRGRRPTAH